MFSYTFKEMRLMDALPLDLYQYALDKFKLKIKSIAATNKVQVRIQSAAKTSIPVFVSNSDKTVSSIFKVAVNKVLVPVKVVIYFDTVGDYNNISCSIEHNDTFVLTDIAKVLGIHFIADCPNLLYCSLSGDKFLPHFKIRVPISNGRHIEYEFDHSNSFVSRVFHQNVNLINENVKSITKTLAADIDLSKEHTFVHLMILGMNYSSNILESYGFDTKNKDLNSFYQQYLVKYDTYKDQFVNEIDLNEIINYEQLES